MRPDLSLLNALPRWSVPVMAAALLFGAISLLTWVVMDRQAPIPQVEPIVLPQSAPVYPLEKFSTTTQNRRVVFSTDATLGNVFVGLDAAQVVSADTTARNTAANPEVQLAAGRKQLEAGGYSWSAEGFINAARKGDVKALFNYLTLGMDPDAQNAFGSSALYAAAENNQPEAVKLLAAGKANIDLPNTQQVTPLMRAADRNLPEMVGLLLHLGADPRAANAEGWTPVFYAVQNNNLPLVEVFLKAGVDPNRQDRFGATPLMQAVRKDLPEMVKGLVKLGARIDQPDVSGFTALHIAVKTGDYQLAKFLLDSGAKVDAPSRGGQTPIDVALAQNDLAMANLLLARGAKRPAVMGR